ncbi:MAG: LysR family transcriptional regulator [Alcaligenaceae bacterium]|nr:LysR family transcriptional regulator [Alcaligenaceae bacterium]
MDLKHADLNLLVAFDVLMSECHVTRAAYKMGVSQSSMSLALSKLRTLFSDELLVRSSKGLIRTDRALDLIPKVAEILRRADSLLNEDLPFNPAEIDGVVTMIVIDYIDFVVIPHLMERIQQEAPKLSLHIIGPNPRRLGEIMSGTDLDMAITYFPAPPNMVRTRPLFKDRMVGIARLDHPLFDAPISLARYCQFGHVAITPAEGADMYNEPIKEAVNRLGVQRHIAISKPTFMGVPFLIGESDLISTMPERIAKRFTNITKIRTFELPFHLEPINVVLMWHDRTHNHPLHRWLRDVIADVCTHRINRVPLLPGTGL